MTEPAKTKWDYDPPQVSWDPVMVDGRVAGYRVDPPFGMNWPHIKTLQHYAALITVRTGIEVRVIVVSASGGDDEFEIRTPHEVVGSKTYTGAFSWLGAFECGVHEVRHLDQQSCGRGQGGFGTLDPPTKETN